MSSDSSQPCPYVSRGGLKLAHALQQFNLSIENTICADLGSNVGGFVDCLIQHGAAKVFAVERGYGQLDYRLRQNSKVVAMERVDALHVRLPQPVDFVTIDAGWTRQDKILGNAKKLLKPQGQIISLIKPHYEAGPEVLHKGVLPDQMIASTLAAIRQRIQPSGLTILAESESPILGGKGNREFLWLIAADSTA